MSMVEGAVPGPPAMGGQGHLVGGGGKAPQFPPQANFPPSQHGLPPQAHQQGQPGQHHQPLLQQLPGAPRQGTFSPPTVPGMKSMAGSG